MRYEGADQNSLVIMKKNYTKLKTKIPILFSILINTKTKKKDLMLITFLQSSMIRAWF